MNCVASGITQKKNGEVLELWKSPIFKEFVTKDTRFIYTDSRFNYGKKVTILKMAYS